MVGAVVAQRLPSDEIVPRRGRPRKEGNREAILAATRRVVARTGYNRLTLEAVAQEAGLYRRYINRTWPSKAHLVRDALFAEAVRFDAPDTGSLEGDLRAVLEQHVDLTLRPEFLRGLAGLSAEFQLRPELFAETLQTYVRPPVEAMATVLNRAMQRGEIGDSPDPAVVVSTVSGAIQQLALLGLLDRDGLVRHAEAMVVGGLIRD